MNDERTRQCLRQVEYIHGHLWTSQWERNTVCTHMYDRLKSASELKPMVIPQIGIHWRHYLESLSCRVFSNQHPFQIIISMADLLVRVRVRTYVSDVNLKKWETAIDLRIWKKYNVHRSEMQMSVTYKSDMVLRIGSRLETGRRSESYIYADCLLIYTRPPNITNMLSIKNSGILMMSVSKNLLKESEWCFLFVCLFVFCCCCCKIRFVPS